MKLKHDNFIRIASSRSEKIVSAIKQLRNFSNSSFYEFSEEDIADLFDRIEKEMKESRDFLMACAKRESKRKKL